MRKEMPRTEKVVAKVNADWTFSFRPRSPFAGGLPPSEDVAKLLMRQLSEPHVNRKSVLLELIRLYRSTGRGADALAVAADYLVECSDVEARAEVYFHLGQAMEHVQDWESAIRWYTQAKELKPRNRFYRYLIHNNIGYSLNQQHKYSEAELILRIAITIDPTRANAFKNLGLCFEGQKKSGEAARMYIAAVHADAADPRALRHLTELAERHPEIVEEVPNIWHEISKCREAVEYAARCRWEKQ